MLKKAKKLISVSLALAMSLTLFALAPIPASAAKEIVGAIPSAFVTKLGGNKNDLTVIVTELFSDGSLERFTETFSIDNNSSGTYCVGGYKVYVDTKGNDQIRECRIVEWPAPNPDPDPDPDPEDPTAASTIPYPASFDRPATGNYENNDPLVVQKPWDIFDGIDSSSMPLHTGTDWHQTYNLKRPSVPFIETGEANNLSISFNRDWYGTAITSVNYNGWEYIYNSFSGTANMHGGGSLQSAFFYDAVLPHPDTGVMTAVNQEYNNPIESHGIWILRNQSQSTQGADAGFYLGKQEYDVPRSSQIAVIQGTCQFWTSHEYINWSDPMCEHGWYGRSPGNHNDQLSDTSLSKTYTLGWVGQVGNEDLYWPNVLVTDMALQKPTNEKVLSIDVLSGYHYDCEMPDYYEYDPRTGDHDSLTMVYPYDTRMGSSSYNVVMAVTAAIDDPAVTLRSGYELSGRTLEANQYVLLTAQADIGENGLWKIVAGGAERLDDDVAFPPTLGQFLKYKAVLIGGQQWTLTKEGLWKPTINHGILPQIVASEDGQHAMAMWTPQIPLSGEGGGGTGMYTRTRFNYTDINGWEIRMMPPTLGGEADPPRYKAYLIMGTLEEVLTTMDEMYEKALKVLSPSVFDWTFYRNVTLGDPSMTEEQARLHWLCIGADEGLLGKEGFDWGAKPESMDNFSYVLSQASSEALPAELVVMLTFDTETDWTDNFTSQEPTAGGTPHTVTVSGGSARIEVSAEPEYYAPSNAYYSRLFSMGCDALGMKSGKPYTIIMKYKVSASPMFQMFQTYDREFGYGPFWPTWDASTGTGGDADFTFAQDGEWNIASYTFGMSGDEDLRIWLRAFANVPLTGMVMEIGAIAVFQGVVDDPAAFIKSSDVDPEPPPSNKLVLFEFEDPSEWASNFVSMQPGVSIADGVVSIPGPKNGDYARLFLLDGLKAGMERGESYTIVVRYRSEDLPELGFVSDAWYKDGAAPFDGYAGEALWSTDNGAKLNGDSVAFIADGEWTVVAWYFSTVPDYDDINVYMRTNCDEVFSLEIDAIAVFKGEVDDPAAAIGKPPQGKTYSVAWYADGGLPAPSQTMVAEGGMVYAPVAMAKSGYRFGGWYADSEFTVPVAFPVRDIAGDVTFFAKWTDLPPGAVALFTFDDVGEWTGNFTSGQPNISVSDGTVKISGADYDWANIFEINGGKPGLQAGGNYTIIVKYMSENIPQLSMFAYHAAPIWTYVDGFTWDPASTGFSSGSFSLVRDGDWTIAALNFTVMTGMDDVLIALRITDIHSDNSMSIEIDAMAIFEGPVADPAAAVG